MIDKINKLRSECDMLRLQKEPQYAGFVKALEEIPAKYYKDCFFPSVIGGESVLVNAFNLMNGRLFFSVAPVAETENKKTVEFGEYSVLSMDVAENITGSVETEYQKETDEHHHSEEIEKRKKAIEEAEKRKKA